MTSTRFAVWKIARNGEYSKMLKEYKTFLAARDRARRAADSEFRPGVRYIVSKSVASGPLMGEKRADEVGMDGIEYKGNAEFEAEA